MARALHGCMRAMVALLSRLYFFPSTFFFIGTAPAREGYPQPANPGAKLTTKFSTYRLPFLALYLPFFTISSVFYYIFYNFTRSVLTTLHLRLSDCIFPTKIFFRYRLRPGNDTPTLQIQVPNPLLNPILYDCQNSLTIALFLLRLPFLAYNGKN